MELLSGSNGKLPYFIKKRTNIFVIVIVTSKKSKILKYENWAKPLIESNVTNFLKNLILLFYVRNIFK